MQHPKRSEGSLNRRQLVGAGLAGAVASQLPFFASTARGHGSRLFSLGVATILLPQSPITTLKSFVVEAGHSGVVPA